MMDRVLRIVCVVYLLIANKVSVLRVKKAGRMCLVPFFLV